MRLLVCLTDANPCPVSDQAWVSLGELIDPNTLGLTPEMVAKALAVGFAFVVGSYLLGWSIGLAKGMVRKV
ncbi:hypothetical protein [Paracidovorax citrulli]|uniref:hypothetical protein n=1 Tax=Paracidovorax citrulli TaxID=80869 RepID=UPI001269D64B|nr:hypothetical protein [Paracidovorax citrulli]UEG48112.1 hypothetical protein LKW27_09770 [Paracidovorax citrulli]UMT96629.1 hypothetical protein FRC97_17405 [Paracidovorax citrulli]